MSDPFLPVYLPSLATLVLLAIGLVFNNSRLGDVNLRINDLRQDTMRHFDEVGRRMDETNRRLDEVGRTVAELRDVVVGKLGEVEHRLAKIEARLP